MKTRKWRKHKLSEVADLCLGKMLDKKKNKGELHPYLGNIHVRWGRFNLEGLPEMRFESHEHDRYGLKCGDLVVCEGGEPGRCALWKGQVPGMKIQKALHRVRPHKSLDGNYLLYWFLHAGQRNYFDQYSTGATIKHLPGEKLARIEIDVPDLPSQKKIAGILSAYDDLIENNLRRIAILEEMAQSLYREWFVHFRFPGHETVQLVDSELGKIPEGWEVKKLGEIAEDVRRGIPKGKLDEASPYVGLEHIPRKSLALDNWEVVSELGSNKLTFKPGEILFGKIRPYFHKVSVAPFYGICSADTIVIKGKQPEHHSLVTAIVSSEAFVAHASATANGAKMPRASWKVLVEYPIVQPPEDLLKKFSSFFQNVIDQQQVLVGQNQNLRKTRDLLLPKLLR